MCDDSFIFLSHFYMAISFAIQIEKMVYNFDNLMSLIYSQFDELMYSLVILLFKTLELV